MPDLENRLKSRHWKIRLNAVKEIGKLEDQAKAIELYVERLGDRSEKVEELAFNSLALIGKAAVPVLITALKNENPKIRCNAAELLGWASDVSAVPALFEALNDGHVRVRRNADDALEDLERKYSGIMKKVIDGLGDKPSDFPALMGCLNYVNAEIQDYAAERVLQLGEPSVVHLIEFMKGKTTEGNKLLRSKCADILGDIGVVSAVPLLIETLNDKDEGVASGAAYALGKIGDTSAVVPLTKALEHEHSGVREAAAWALGEIGHISAKPFLIQRLQDPDEFVLQSTVSALAKFCELEEIREVLQSSTETSDPKEVKERTMLYMRLVDDLKKEKDKINMPGELLPDKPKPPKGTFRQRRALRN